MLSCVCVSLCLFVCFLRAVISAFGLTVLLNTFICYRYFMSLSLVVLCEYSKFRIESNSYLLFDSIRNWRNYSKFSNSYLTVISRVTETRFVCTLPATSRCTHMSLNPVLLRMCAYPSHFPFRNWSSHLRKNEYNIPTFENGKNYSIWFEISNNSPIFNLIRFEMKKHYSHSTNRLLPVFSNKWLIDWLIKGTSHPQSVTTVELVLLAGQLKIITTGAATVT